MGEAGPGLSDVDLNELDDGKACEIAHTYLAKKCDVYRTDFLAYGPVLHVVVNGNLTLKSLPTLVGGAMCYYKSLSDMDEPTGFAHSLKEPAPQVIDNSDCRD